MRATFLLACAAAMASIAVAAGSNYFVGVNVGKKFRYDLKILNCEQGALGLGPASLACSALGGVIVQLHSANLSDGSGSYNRTTFTIGVSPCPHVGARHEFFTASFNGSMGGPNAGMGGPNGTMGGSNGTMGGPTGGTGGPNGTMGGPGGMGGQQPLNGTGGQMGGNVNFSNGNWNFSGVSVSANISYDAYAHYLALTHLFTYNETNSLPGAQAEEFLGALPICGGIFNKLVSWAPLKYANWTYEGSEGLVVVHNFTKCANVTSPRGSLGSICFVFAIGNGSYVYNGVQRLPGQVKVDKIFIPSALLQFANVSSGVAGVYYSSSDAASASVNFKANTNAKENAAKNIASFQPNVLVSFGNGASAYLNWNTSIAVKSLTGTISTANVNVSEWSTTTFKAALNISSPLGGFAQNSAMVTRSALVFSFERPLGTVDSMVWDPEMGQASISSTSDPAATSTSPKAAVNVKLSGLVLLIASFFAALLLL